VRICRIPDVGVSSSEIRRRVKEGKSIRYMVIEDVEEYIVRHRLYLR
jgi:nicotinate-nucleotide adenylyltransferase